MSQVVPISLGSALNTTLDNYYDLLKNQLGGLQSEEYLQLKLVADPVDISAEKYPYWSMYNLLTRSDLSIEPRPVNGTIVTSVVRFSDLYGTFLRRLRGYVVLNNFTPQEQAQISDLDAQADDCRRTANNYVIQDRVDWKNYCDALGFSQGDNNAYLQWVAAYGHGSKVADLLQQARILEFRRRTILNKQYADPEDQAIVNAESDYNEIQMRLRYPINQDDQYSDHSQFSLTYLANLPAVSTCLFDDRRAESWSVSVADMMATAAGNFIAHWDRTTSSSSSISTDWSSSGSVSYFIVSVKVSASNETQIKEDFSNTTGIDLGAKAAYKAQILYPGWFHPELFECKHVKNNVQDFSDYFGKEGSLLYYPTHLVLVRGFAAKFTNSQQWTYDYKHDFQASVGGGFSICGIDFGGSSTYGSHTKDHQVDQSNTSLAFSDDASTLRFIGYVVKKNTIMQRVSNLSPIDATGGVLRRPGYTYAKQ